MRISLHSQSTRTHRPIRALACAGKHTGVYAVSQMLAPVWTQGAYVHVCAPICAPNTGQNKGTLHLGRWPVFVTNVLSLKH